MSIEALAKSLTDALNANTAALAAHTAAMSGAAAPAAATPAKQPAKRTRTRAPKKNEPAKASADLLLEKFGHYLKTPSTREEQQRAGTTIHPIIDKFGVTKVSEIPEDSHAEAMALLEPLQAAFDEGGIEAAEAVELFPDEGGDDAGLL